MYKLQTRKMFEKVKIVKIELFISSNTKRFQINAYASRQPRNHILNSYDSLTYKKWLEQFTDQLKKAKKLLESWNWTYFPYITIRKALKYKPCLSFRACQKKVVQFNSYNFLTSKNSLKSIKQLKKIFWYKWGVNTH